jgi:hypothetical protein
VEKKQFLFVYFCSKMAATDNFILHYNAHRSRKLLVLVILCLFHLVEKSNSLYYDGIESYSVYPRLDLHLCANSSLSFDFTISSSSSSNSATNGQKPSAAKQQSISNSGRLLLYSEQQIEISSQKVINSYFIIKIVNNNRLIVNDYWSNNEVVIQLPVDYQTSWFKFVYTRQKNLVDMQLFKYESSPHNIILIPLFNKQLIHSSFIEHDLDNFFSSSASSSELIIEQNDVAEEESMIDSLQASHSYLLVGGISDTSREDPSIQFSYKQLKMLNKFHGYIMNLKYTSLVSQCSIDSCSKNTIMQRQYAIFSSSTSKQYKLDHQFLDRDLLMIDDICESNTLSHDLCPRDCTCLSNNFVAPYFSCECPNSEEKSNQTSSSNHHVSNSLSNNKAAKCSALYKSYVINLDDSSYFGGSSETSTNTNNQQPLKFDYPIMPSFTKVNVEMQDTMFDRLKGVQFKQQSKLLISPSIKDMSKIPMSEACFWNLDDCTQGFVQHIVMSIDRLDEKKVNQKVKIDYFFFFLLNCKDTPQKSFN